MEYPEKTPGDELQKMPHTKARRFKPQERLDPHNSTGGRLGNANRYTMRHSKQKALECEIEAADQTFYLTQSH